MPPSSQLPAPPLGPRHWPVWLGIGAMALAARVTWPLQRGLGALLGATLRLALPQRRRIVERNLALCFPQSSPAERDQLLRRHFRALGIGVFEFARAWWGSLAPLHRGLRIEGLEHAHAAIARKRGVIVVSGHFTTLEVCGRLLCEAGVPLAGMYRPHAQPAMEWAVRRGRARYAQAMFPKSDVRGVARHLKRGGLLWYAPDQDPSRGDTVYVPFFGQSAHSLTSTHQLARLSGAEVLLFQHARRADGGYDLRLTPLPDFPTGDAAADTARIMAGIETMARAAPDQYLWIHRRFKRRADGSDPYR